MNPDFEKGGGLLPVIIQNAITMQVLMLGYMNEEALKRTCESGQVTFYSRAKQRLWTKGESSGHFLEVREMLMDCDSDTMLIKVIPNGPTCHTGSISCFEANMAKGFLYQLQHTIDKRIIGNAEDSYTNALYRKGINKIAQKVGEEAVELVIEAKDDRVDLFKAEAADLLFHLLVLLRAKNIRLEDVESVLNARQRPGG